MKINKKGNILLKFCVISISIFTLTLGTTMTVFAAEDPLVAINNLSNFIFSLTRAIGSIILVIGIIQFGASYQRHDPSQRTNSIFTVVGGVIITFAKEILSIITGG